MQLRGKPGSREGEGHSPSYQKCNRVKAGGEECVVVRTQLLGRGKCCCVFEPQDGWRWQNPDHVARGGKACRASCMNTFHPLYFCSSWAEARLGTPFMTQYLF
jgi:hypothetical protein